MSSRLAFAIAGSRERSEGMQVAELIHWHRMPGARPFEQHEPTSFIEYGNRHAQRGRHATKPASLILDAELQHPRSARPGSH